MSKNTTDLREAIAKIMTDYGVDFYEGNLMHRHEQRLALIKEFQDQILLLISSREKLLLDRVEKEILSDDGTNTMFTEWNGMQIADLDMQKTKLTTLRKELE